MFRTAGVLTGSKSLILRIGDLFMGRFDLVSGYLVNAKAAIDLLAASAPTAAQWRQSNTAEYLDGRRGFVFDADCPTRSPPSSTRGPAA